MTLKIEPRYCPAHNVTFLSKCNGCEAERSRAEASAIVAGRPHHAHDQVSRERDSLATESTSAIALAHAEKHMADAPASDPKHAKKMDAGKIPIYQGCFAYFGRALMGVALISEYGKRKYAPTNPVFNTGWAEVPQGELRYRDAEGRHLLKADIGSTGLYDDESEMAHALHKAWNALADAERLLREGKIELRCGAVIVNGKPQPGTSKLVEL